MKTLPAHLSLHMVSGVGMRRCARTLTCKGRVLPILPAALFFTSHDDALCAARWKV